ncbi:MAG: beta-lactamase family protein [Candidatus Symbiothrix sp.]|jgi:CubicO group peptidase (beta-lactamase class C family)|nr:beta-lactamase family protein [Candidatus Symbiothrix sp.]
MKNSIYILIFAACLLLAVNPVMAREELPRSTPENENISLEGIQDYLNALKDNQIEIHSLMIVRNGKVAYEEWFNGASPDSLHVMNSVSKTFTATAIGFAVEEGLIGLEDKVISFFPDQLPDTLSPYLAQLRIWDLLTMSVGQAKEPVRTGDNWIKDFFATPITIEPGTHFYYNSMGSFMLSAIIQKVTGRMLFDYLTPRLFEPLHIHNIYWEKNSQGMNVGGWGLFIKTEDMAKFGLLYLQNGVWEGKQLLPKGWVEQASALQIENPAGYPGDGAPKPGDDWAQGYCFQMWRCKHNAYRMDGALGQFVFILPEKNTVIAITSNTQNTGTEISLLWDYLLPALK